MKIQYLIISATLLLTQLVQADNVVTGCEQIGQGQYACDTFPVDNSPSNGIDAQLVSQTWQITYGGFIVAQSTGSMIASCSSSHSNASYQFIAELNTGQTFFQTGTLPCAAGGGGGSAGPGSGCFGRLDQFGNCINPQ